MSKVQNIFVGRERESRRLREAILSRQSLMIAGANDMGKTALIQNVVARLPLSVKQHCLYIGTFKDLHDLLQRILVAMYKGGDARLKGECRAEGITKTNLGSRLKHCSSSQLRGKLYHVAQGKQYRIFLDHCPALTPSVARVVKELFWMRQTPVYPVPSAQLEAEVTKAGRYFYWSDGQILRLGPLPPGPAHRLIEHCIHEYGLSSLELRGFREEVLELSHLAPGTIVAMCRMAANPRYRFNARIKTRLIHIDYMMRGSAPDLEPARTSRHR
jgi:hypothetical protein